MALREASIVSEASEASTDRGSSSEEFVRVAYDSPLASPLLSDLEYEYDTRYGSRLGEPASVELARYPPEAFAPPEGAFLLLLRDGEPIAGGAFKRLNESTAEIKRVWTHPHHRRQGLSRRVMSELEGEAEERGYERIFLTTGPRQPEAQNLYRTLGYTALFDESKRPEEIGLHAYEKALHPRRRRDPAPPLPAGVDLRALSERPVVPLRHPLRWIATAVVLVLVLNLVQTLFTNPSWEWSRVGKWLFSPAILTGLSLTVQATAISAVVSFAGGIVVALGRLSRNPVLSALSWLYIWLFRSLPLVLVLIFLFNLGNLYPEIGIGVPFGPQLQLPTVALLSNLALGVIGLSLNEIAYSAEVVRAGVLAVDQGQHEAAKALGIPRARQFRRIVLPQALRSIVPAYVNQIIGLLKASSLLFYVSLLDIFGVVQNLGSTYPTDIIPLLVVASIWYLALTSAVSVVQFHVERHYARGALRSLPPTPLQSARARLLTLGQNLAGGKR